MAIIERDLNDVLLFAKVVEKGSFTAAGAALGLQVSTVSRRVARLEEQLGSRLLHRTTRKLSLTDAGRTYHGMAVAGLEQLDAATAAVGNLRAEPSGRIRFTGVPGGGLAWDLIGPFMDAHPKVSIEMNLTERNVDLVGEGYDVALRVGKLPDSTLVAKHLADTQSAVFASPEYLAARGTPGEPEELSNHACVVSGLSVSGATWPLASGRRVQRVPVSGRLATTSFETLMHACASGLGIALLPKIMCSELVQRGALVRVLPNWCGPTEGVYLVYPTRHHMSPTVRAFIDFVSDQLARWMASRAPA